MNLYTKHENDKRTPLEDFTTELLAGILESDREILDDYTNKILIVEGEAFEITSQKPYTLEDDTNCIIDMVIENDKTICFIENKVNSSEGERQLERYTKVLENIKKQQGKNVYLRYCTKYHDFKDSINNIDFIQFRWRDVYKYFSNVNKDNDSKLIEEFLRFLRSKGMGNAGDFNYEDLIAMKEINETIKKMDECLNRVKPKLIECFGQPYEYDYERLKQIRKWNQYVMWKDNIIGESGYSEITIGFGFNDKIGFGNKEEENQVPYLKVFIWIEKDNSEYETIKKLYSKDLEEVFDCYDYDKDGIYYAFEEPFSLFVSARNQDEVICGWFNDKINRINELKNCIKIKWS